MSQFLTQRYNSNASKICDLVCSSAAEFGVVTTKVGGARIISFSDDGVGTMTAGIRLAEICLGGVGRVRAEEATEESSGTRVFVDVSEALAGCMGCQYAGWMLATEKYFAMCSGPIRLLRGREHVLEEYQLQQRDDVAIGVLESSQIPDEATVAKVAEECGLPAEKITLCVANTASIPGSLQVVARSVETAIHKLHELKFDLAAIKTGTGNAPLPPKTDSDLVALGWTNDAMLYGADVQLTVDCEDESIEAILDQTPSRSSQEFGTPFLELFERYDRDFYKIDKMLFSPAKISFHNLRSGRTHTSGELRPDILKKSFENA